MMILILPTIIWGGLLLIRNFAPSVTQKVVYDLDENRNLASFPTNTNIADFPGQFEQYYNDHLPFRSIIIKANRKITNTTEKIYTDHLQQALIDIFYKNYGTNDEVETSETLEDFENLFNETTEVPTTEVATHPVTTETQDNETTDIDKHNYTVIEKVDATCLKDGYVKYRCADCGREYEEILPATGHKEQVVKVVPPTYEEEGYTLYECTMCGELRKGDFKAKLVDSSFFPPRVQNGVLIGREGWYFYTMNNSIEYYCGTNIMDEAQMSSYLSTMKKLQSICDSQKVQLQYAIFPNKEQVYSEYMPTYDISNTYKRVPRFIDYVRNNSNINIIYPLNELKASKAFGQLYFKYDTHWNSAGSFIGAQALLKAMGMGTTSILNVHSEIGDIPGEGDLINIGGLDRNLIKNEINYKIAYKPEIQMSGNDYDAHLYQGTSTSTNNKKVVIIGDSFRRLLLQYLTKEFSSCTAIYRNYIDDPGAIQAIKDADVIILEAIERYDDAIISDSNTVINILSSKSK